MTRYKQIKIGGRRIGLHRYVWECSNGPVPDGLIVHHVNGDRLDNRIENLMLMTHQQHSEHHNQKHPISRACDVCGKVYTPHPTKRTRSRTCSRECFRVLASRIAHERSERPGMREKMAEAARLNGSAERAKTLVLHRWHPELVPLSVLAAVEPSP